MEESGGFVCSSEPSANFSDQPWPICVTVKVIFLSSSRFAPARLNTPAVRMSGYCEELGG